MRSSNGETRFLAMKTHALAMQRVVGNEDTCSSNTEGRSGNEDTRSINAEDRSDNKDTLSSNARTDSDSTPSRATALRRLNRSLRQ
ncbi:hypothetical protein AMTR_s00101p00132330 [Amborella trichopoda]|uniref:Uncharacterized protein n=1 Tax=Amborella trichopoda TaxID=13333 RepID=W1NWP3_AMBTC|nr:hypothetical protein AMTR_s00101p00132330 [Amborella trichopoda]